MLFQLMNIPEADQLLMDLKDPPLQGEQAKHSYEQILTGLVEEGIIELDNQQITIDPQIYNLLTGCKLSSAITRLDLRATDGKSSVTYGFLSGMQMVEWVWEPAQDQALLTSFDEFEKMFQVIGNRIELPDPLASNVNPQSQDTIRTPMQVETLQRLSALAVDSALEMIESILQEDRHLDQTLMQTLAKGFATLEKWGQYEVYTRGQEGQPQTIYFIGSIHGNWLFLEGEEKGLFTAFKITEEELVQSLFLLTTRSLSVLSGV
ncbi:hypothetical protein ABEW61_01170 [Paenibacillus amylolyticus]|uniref:hypothetical protein n=1 Tax=Paenibacillus TaxID=44249 RepID=UPI00249B99C7|nr:hypothetical protein [Paenibacillus amylolyticus]WFA84907.1 hypothetical protein OGI70_29040 [Paenibacillus amylolyticus]